MITALEIIVVILALLIIGVVVAQKSKTQGMGAGFGGGADDLFGSRARGMDAFQNDYHLIGIVCRLYLRVGQIDAYLLMKLMRAVAYAAALFYHLFCREEHYGFTAGS